MGAPSRRPPWLRLLSPHRPSGPAAPEPKPSHREYAKLIQALADDGLSAPQIGRRLGMSRQRVMRIAAQYDVRLEGRGGRHRLTTTISGGRLAVVQILDDKAGVALGTMLVRLATKAMDGGASAAERKLGKEARPRRRYKQRESHR